MSMVPLDCGCARELPVSIGVTYHVIISTDTQMLPSLAIVELSLSIQLTRAPSLLATSP